MSSKTTNKFSPEVGDRAVRMALDHEAQHLYRWATILSIAAIPRVLGATWQRCRLHWMRNALAHVPKAQQPMAEAALRQALLQPDQDSVRQPGATSPTSCARDGSSSAR